MERSPPHRAAHETNPLVGQFKRPWREAGPPSHHDDKVDSDLEVVHGEVAAAEGLALAASRKVDVRLPVKENGARPVHLIITMIKWIRSRRLSLVPGGHAWRGRRRRGTCTCRASSASPWFRV